MSLKNFDTDLDTQGVARMVVVTETVAVSKPSPRSVRQQFVGKPAAAWSWDDLRDYVVHEIEERFGAFPRDAKKEYGIFTSFLARWGEQAPAIARYAFEVADGRWKGAPISVTRFCKGSDPYFAAVIVDRLVDEPILGW